MLSPQNSERLIGAIIALFGLVFSLHTISSFDLGTFRRIGPGMFPLGLGIAMTLLGIGIAVLTPDAERTTPEFSFRSMILVLLSVAAFAIVIAYFGLVPAIVVSVLIASCAEQPFKPVGAALVAVALCVAGWLIFKVGLGLSLPIFRWPF